MAKRGHSEEEILRGLREAESGDTVVELCRKHGYLKGLFWIWVSILAQKRLCKYCHLK
jgi:transposase-like protein